MEFKIKFSDAQQDIVVTARAEDSFAQVAQQVRACKGWNDSQHVRFICGGQELYMDDPCSRATGSVLHCIPSAHERHRGAQQRGKAEGQQVVDWLEVVDPGTVLMWIFGSILALLWLLFVFYAHMFDRTSVIMLCMMTVAFLIPCVLSYIPALRLLANPVSSIPPARQQTYHYSQSAGAAAQSLGGSQTASWTAQSSGVPPRPAARVRGPASRQPGEG